MACTVIAHYRCAPTDEATVRAALLKAQEATRTEPANLMYEVHTVTGEPGGFLLYERYTDQAGFEAHKAAEHFQELIVKTTWPLLTDRSVTFAESI
ncbi:MULTISPECIES: putative quinol monooxygenase [unclassified Streptomyces]|uniref:putative quinol monooxygenase n=1 Tax=unclassified Streptomyces TaxID=2593676 RepID=UPI002E18078A|nr:MULTISPECIES: putative quinol monooxygenase [unclassified Streptomyces]